MEHSIDLKRPEGKKVLIMGLGINGGGLSCAKYFAERGALVTVTDLSTEERLRPSLEKLSPYPIRYVLGRHEEEDFRQADLVVKNPAVKPNSPFLRNARRITTDIEIFLVQCSNPVLAVTGSKGKSTTVSALYHILKGAYPGSQLGGNITRSPLDFLSELDGSSPVVLELSSWQLGGLVPPTLLRARVAAITNLFYDHMNYYSSMEEYARDKERIFAGQGNHDWSVINLDNPWGSYFATKTQAQLAVLSLKGRITHPKAQAYAYYQNKTGILEWKGRRVKLVPSERRAQGLANDYALLFASVMAAIYGLEPDQVRQRVQEFTGIPHRMEICHQARGITFINDTAATIPEASTVSFESVSGRVHWITGGTDKNLNLSPLEKMMKKPASLVLMEGSATQRMMAIFQAKGWSWLGPFKDFETALRALEANLRVGDTVLMSPGAASFELFQNEFDRGEKFRLACVKIYGE